MSLRARMGVAAGVAVALAVIAVAITAYAGTRSELRGQLDSSLRGLARPVLVRAGAFPPGPPGSFSPDRGGPPQPPGAGARRPGAGARTAGRRPGDRDEGLGLDLRPSPAFGGAAGTFTLVYSSGLTFVPRGQSYRIPLSSRARALAARGSGHYLADMNVDGERIRVLATGIGSRGALLVALPLTDVDHALSSQLLLLWVIAAGGIGLAGLLGILVARAALAPIARFTRQTESIAASPDRLDRERLDVSGRDELARLARTFNSTLDALELSVQAQRNLVADASHELRTPIATLRANLQLMLDENQLTDADRDALRADMIDELDELTGLIGDVVELARGSKPNAALGEVRLDAIVVAAVERARRRAPLLTVQTSIEPTLIRGEGDRIARAVTNLLDNACKWSPSAGLIEVALVDGTLTVRDHGPGFHEEDLPFVFDRFHRAKDARSKPGSGLGLAIVRQAAEAHGGFVEAENVPGNGALLRASFGQPVEFEEMTAHHLAAPNAAHSPASGTPPAAARPRPDVVEQ